MKRKVFLIVLLFAFLSLSSVSAIDSHNSTIDSYNDIKNGCNQYNFNNNLLSDDEKPDVPDLIIEKTHNVTPSNINLYFNNGVLNKKFSGETLLFSGNFEEMGVLNINHNNVKIIGDNASLKNTVFNIELNSI